MKLALVKIDSGKGIQEGPAAFRIEKVINFFSLFKNHQMNAAEFPRLLCSSADGRWLGIYVPLQKKRGKSITGKVLLVDFLKESIRVNQDVEKWVGEAAIFEKKFTFHEFTDTVNIKGICMNPRAVRWYEYDLKTNVFRTSSGFEISPSPYNQFRLECLYRHALSGTPIYPSDSGIVVENSRYGFLKTYSANPVVRISRAAGLTTIGLFHAGDSIIYTDSSPERNINFFDHHAAAVETRLPLGNHWLNDSVFCSFEVKSQNARESSSNYIFSSFFVNETTLHSGGKASVCSYPKEVVFGKTRLDLGELRNVHGKPGTFCLLSGKEGLFFDAEQRLFRHSKFKEIDQDELISPQRESEKHQVYFGWNKDKSGAAISINKPPFSVEIPYQKVVVSDVMNKWGAPGETEDLPKMLNVDISRDERIFFMKDDESSVLSATWENGKTLWKNTDYFLLRSIKLSDDQQTIAVALKDYSLDLLYAGNGKKYLSMVIDTASGEWVVWTPAGYYDCSPGGERLIGWSVSRGNDSLPTFFPAARFRNQFFRPDVIDSVLKYRNEDVALKKLGLLNGLIRRMLGNKYAKDVIASNLPPVIRLESPGMNEFFSDSLITVSYQLREGGSPVYSLKVYIDGRFYEARTPERNHNAFSLKIPPKSCIVGLVASSAAGESEMASARIIWKGKNTATAGFQKPDLYILAVGISKYQKKDLELKLASKDANDFCHYFLSQSGKLYNQVKIKLLTDSLATKAGILSAMEWLEKSAGSRDVSMIFLAGHGENDDFNNFYFLPWEANQERMKSTCLPYHDLKSTITALPGKVVVFADACRSGNIFGDLTRRSANVDLLALELASSNGGAVVFTSSGRKQASLENESWGNGAFTKAIIEGLEGKADIFQDGYITIKSLDVYISRRVKELTQGKQTPQVIVPESISDFAVSVGN